MRTNKKILYESNQVLQAQIERLTNEIYSIRMKDINNSNTINPYIVNSVAYDVALTAADKIEAASRYNTEIPELNLPSNKLETLFYDMGSLAFFTDDNGYCKVSTFAKGGKLNGLGDLEEIQPIDFSGKAYGFKRQVVYTYSEEKINNPCVIISDYTGCWTETNILPRAAINRCSILDQASVYRKMQNAIKITAKKAIALIDD